MFDLSAFATTSGLISLLTLTLMEIVLGIDNVVFISILAEKLPPDERPKARWVGLSLALIMRVGLLFAIQWIMSLNNTLFALLGHEISGRDLILLGGGLFLIAKSTHEIYSKLEADEKTSSSSRASFGAVVAQIIVLDIVFSLDSVITAVGMAQNILVMIVATLIAVAVMMIFSKTIGDFIHRHPSMKVLALSFLLLIGVMLVGESFDQHISKGYVYFAMAFSLGVEILNLRLRKASKPVELHDNMP